MELNEAQQILNKAGLVCEAIQDGPDPELTTLLKKEFQTGMPDGCLVKQVFAANGEAVIRFAGYPRSSRLEVIWEYADYRHGEDGTYAIIINSKEVHEGVAADVTDLIEQVRDFFAPSYWFTRRTH